MIAGAAFLLLRGYVQDRRNDEGIAWAVPKGEHVDLAGAGLAVTEADEGRTLIGRDLETGKRRWSVEFSWPTGYHANQLHRVGRTLILVDRVGDVHALDIGTGRERWTQTPAGDAQPSVATPGVVAFSVCRDRKCHAEARSIADGALVWQAPVDSGDRYLGSPDVGDPPNRGGGLWPASHVLLRTPGAPARYQVRDLATGRVVLRGGGARESAAVVGKLLVRAGQQGPTTATDLTTGREAWRFEEGNLTPMRAAQGETATLGMPDGGLLMSTSTRRCRRSRSATSCACSTRGPASSPSRTADVDGFEEELAPTLDTPITAESVAEGPPARTPALRSDGDVSEIYADGRIYRLDDYERNSIGATGPRSGGRPRCRASAAAATTASRCATAAAASGWCATSGTAAPSSSARRASGS